MSKMSELDILIRNGECPEGCEELARKAGFDPDNPSPARRMFGDSDLTRDMEAAAAFELQFTRQIHNWRRDEKASDDLPTPEDFEVAAATFRPKPEPVATAILSTVMCDNCGPNANYNASAAGLFCVECGAECFEIELDAILEL